MRVNVDDGTVLRVEGMDFEGVLAAEDVVVEFVPVFEWLAAGGDKWRLWISCRDRATLTSRLLWLAVGLGCVRLVRSRCDR